MNKRNKVVFRISVIFLILGLILIYISNLIYEPELIPISDIDQKLIGKTIKINGEITYSNLKDNNLFMDISDNTSDIFVVKFDYNSSFEIGKNIYVIGKVNIYQGELEIIADQLIPE